MQTRRRAAWVGGAALVALWCVGVVWSLAGVTAYQSTPGIAARAGVRWPADAGDPPDSTRATLLLFAHPQCPCTRATIEELDRLLGECDGRLAVQVRFYSDPALGDDWTHSALWERTARIPGVAVTEDRLGAHARRFGVSTSGQALLYAADGRLLFQGGITASRGHEGDNLGRASILAHLDGRPAPARSPVFGCGLLTPEAL